MTKATNGQQSVNFVLSIPDEQAKTQTITLNLANVPFTEVLKYVGELAGLKFEYEKYAIKVSREGRRHGVGDGDSAARRAGDAEDSAGLQ